MEELGNTLQVGQSTVGTVMAIAAFVLSRAGGRQLAEDIVLAFAAGAIAGSACALVGVLCGGI
jgi:zinc transporter ZupT